jgi:transposase-like protein
MDKNTAAPETLIEAIRYFSNPDVCLSFMVQLRWPDGIVRCPTCGSDAVCFISTRRVWTCRENHERKQFSIKVGTIFEDSPIGLDKWLAGMWLIANCKNGISSYEIHRALDLTQKTAWFMLHRIRLAMEDGSVEKKLRGRVEADETFVGGKVRNMHKSKRLRVMGTRRSGRIGKDGDYHKAIVMGMLERGGRVRTQIIRDIQSPTLQRIVREHVEPGAEVLTDAWRGYRGLSADFIHQYVNHMIEYVRGHVHTNGIENFWSLLKRAIKGTYVNVEPYHLHRYVEEQSFRYNERFGKDGDRFLTLLRGIVGRRITYKQLIGKAPGLAPATT